MPVEFRCAQCQKLLRVGDSATGKKARCPDCGTIQEVPLHPEPQPPATYPPVEPDPIPSRAAPVDSSSPFAEHPSLSPPQEEFRTARENAGRSPFRTHSNPYQPPAATVTRSADLARIRCSTPGTALFVVGCLSVAMHVLSGVVIVVTTVLGLNDFDDVASSVATMVTGLFMGLIVLAGGRKMQQLQSYGLAMTAAVLAILPCHFCCAVTLPVGIWSLIVLLDPQVKDAFR